MLNEASELVPHGSVGGRSEQSIAGDVIGQSTTLSPKLTAQDDTLPQSASSKVKFNLSIFILFYLFGISHIQEYIRCLYLVLQSFPPAKAAESMEEYTDGMTKCLACLSLLGQHLMKCCDRELTYRLQKQNAALVTKMSRLHEHTKMLLFRLAESDNAEVCVLFIYLNVFANNCILAKANVSKFDSYNIVIVIVI